MVTYHSLVGSTCRWQAAAYSGIHLVGSTMQLYMQYCGGTDAASRWKRLVQVGIWQACLLLSSNSSPYLDCKSTAVLGEGIIIIIIVEPC